MLRLALLRHSEANPQTAGCSDRDRPLNQSGREMAGGIGRFCRDFPLHPSLALVSPARRARETFELAAAELALGKDLIESFEPDLYNATATTIKSLIADVASQHRVVLVVGHNPGIAEAAIALCGDGDPAALADMKRHFPAPALAIIDFDMTVWSELAAGQGRLARFVTKSLL